MMKNEFEAIHASSLDDALSKVGRSKDELFFVDEKPWRVFTLYGSLQYRSDIRSFGEESTREYLNRMKQLKTLKFLAHFTSKEFNGEELPDHQENVEKFHSAERDLEKFKYEFKRANNLPSRTRVEGMNSIQVTIWEPEANGNT
jgi:hypothetical protein